MRRSRCDIVMSLNSLERHCHSKIMNLNRIRQTDPVNFLFKISFV